MNDLDGFLTQFEAASSRREVKVKVLDLLTKKLCGKSDPSHCFMMDVAFPYIIGIAHPSHETDYPQLSTQRFKELWDRLPNEARAEVAA